MVRPKIFISKCLWFDACRYNGQILRDSFVEKLKDFCDVVTSCPEVEIGLGVPRSPIRLVYKNNQVKMIQPELNKDLTDDMNNFSDNLLSKIDHLDGAVLQHRSPSCGPNSVKIYDKPWKHIPWIGLFADKLIKKYPGIMVEDEKRLLNYKIRDKWLIVTWTWARFSLVKEKGKIKDLISFHSNHKYLFMMFSKSILNDLWNIVASYNKENYDNTIDDYENKLSEIFSKDFSVGRIKDVIQHILWYFKDKISLEQKDFFLKSLDMYVNSKIPLSTLLWMLRNWAIQYDKDYIKDQVIFEPFPNELLEMKDSGKKINI